MTHKRDPLTVLFTVYGKLIKLMTSNRNVNKTFFEFQLSFSAQLSRFESFVKHTTLPDPGSIFMLLANSMVNTSQRVSISAATTPSPIFFLS